MMSTLPQQALQRVREFGWKYFHRFGIHCATHQIRVLLICSVFITSLSYPALALYSGSQPQFLARYSSRILDSFIAAEASLGQYAQRDLRRLWDAHEALRAREDSVARARCGIEATLRTERILVHAGLTDGPGAITQTVLLATLHLERRIAAALAARRVPCLTIGGGSSACLTISPLAFWAHDERRLRADSDVAGTLELARNASLSVASAGASTMIDITPHMVLAGRELAPEQTRVNYAMFLGLTYFFPENDCSGSGGHGTWIEVLQDAAAGMDVVVEAQQPQLIALEYDPSRSHTGGFSVLSAFLYAAYAAFFVWFSGSMRRLHTVHSRVGLAFTGIIEIIVSTIASLSVCALAGFKITMIPWELFPVVIVFVGAENMFSLVNAVVKTSVALPVKERIASGLSRAGTSNTLKVVSYNAILGVIAFFSVGAIRQFCAFAIVVLVAHWFLVHVFFIAVLSIDIQRLELDELLRQGTSLAPSPSTAEFKEPHHPTTRWLRLRVLFKNLLGGRAAKNLSLLLLLAITGTLYYATYPATARTRADPPVTFTRNGDGGITRVTPVPEVGRDTPAWHIWRLLNPAGDPMVHVRLESPTVVTLRANSDSANSHAHSFGYANNADSSGAKQSARARLAMRTVRLLLWIVKVMVLPIAMTTAVLYALLLYLLKDAELLEAQRHRPGADAPPLLADEDTRIEGPVSFRALPRAFASDVELVATSRDARVVGAVGLHNEVVVWRLESGGEGEGRTMAIDVQEVLRHSAGTSVSASATVTALAVDDEGTLCAVGTGTGVIAIWAIHEATAKLLHRLASGTSSSAVADMQFMNPALPPSGLLSPRASRRSSAAGSSALALVAVHENGIVAKWELGALPAVSQITSSMPEHVLQSTLVRLQAHALPLISFFLSDGTLELRCVLPADDLHPEFRVPAGTPSDTVAAVHACFAPLQGGSHLVIGAATSAGRVTLWDARSGECMAVLPAADAGCEHVGQLRLAPAIRRPCAYCAERPSDVLTLSLSVGSLVLLHRVCDVSQARSCACAHVRPSVSAGAWAGLLEPKERRASNASSAGSATPNPRSRVSSFSGPAEQPYPVSGHGFHSRRASEKELMRRANEVSADDVDPAASNNLISTPTHSAQWSGIVISRVATATFDRGRWDVVGGRVVGLRRTSRERARARTRMPKPQLPESPRGLNTSTLERWELWIFDSSLMHFQSSPLTDLDHRGHDEAPPKRNLLSPSRTPRSLSDSVPRLPFTRVSCFQSGPSHCLAGLGNTIGLLLLSHLSQTEP